MFFKETTISLHNCAARSSMEGTELLKSQNSNQLVTKNMISQKLFITFP